MNALPAKPGHLTMANDESLQTISDGSDWQTVTDHVLLDIFYYLGSKDVLTAAQVCKHWRRISLDDHLWKYLFVNYWKIPHSMSRAPNACNWLSEFKRLSFHAPLVESEVIKDHKDEVLHVSFSHKGDMFATCSKDSFVKVWACYEYPTELKYYDDMKQWSWKYTQFSQFNACDTLLLVSGVYFGSNSTSGEIAIFSLIDHFNLQCRVSNKPYDVFGTWYSENYLLSGSIYWADHLSSASLLWLNKASQALESKDESVVMRLYKFRNFNSSSVRMIMIANCPQQPKETCSKQPAPGATKMGKLPGGKCHERLVTDVTDFDEYGGCSQSQVLRSGRNSLTSGHLLEDHFETSDVKESKLMECRALDEERGERSNLSSLLLDTGSTSVTHSPFLPWDLRKTTIQQRKIERYLSTSDESPRKYSRHCDTYDGDNCHNNEAECDIVCCEERRQTCVVEGGDNSDLLKTCTCHSQGGKVVNGDCDIDHSTSTSDRDSNRTASKNDCNCDTRSGSQDCEVGEKLLIFSKGEKTYSPHQIGIKRMKPLSTIKRSGVVEEKRSETLRLPDVHQLQDEGTHHEPHEYDTVDHVIEFDGHIIGMALSPDHRYLYVNTRSWPTNYVIEDPLEPPPISREIEIHVIDLMTFTKSGPLFQSHLAFTPNDECFFIFLDVTDQYVASGSEDKHAYLWDCHYKMNLAKLPHADVVNCVAFNPVDAEMLVTVSDDFTIKIWRSRHKQVLVEKLKSDNC